MGTHAPTPHPTRQSLLSQVSDRCGAVCLPSEGVLCYRVALCDSSIRTMTAYGAQLALIKASNACRKTYGHRAKSTVSLCPSLSLFVSLLLSLSLVLLLTLYPYRTVLFSSPWQRERGDPSSFVL